MAICPVWRKAPYTPQEKTVKNENKSQVMPGELGFAAAFIIASHYWSD
jgi:hypothetical protein